MEYMSAAEASEKWGVSLRQAQRLLAGGRIPDAKKYGRSWMIPADAPKPPDPRREKKPPQSGPAADLARLVAATSAPLPAHNADAILDAMVEHPILVNRPIVVTPKGVRLSRPSEVVLELLDRLPESFTKEDGEVVRPRA